MPLFTIEIGVSPTVEDFLSSVQKFLAWTQTQANNSNQQLTRIEAKLDALEILMSAADDKIVALKTATDAQFARIGSGLDNIVADEKSILDQLAKLGDLSPESQAIVDGVVTQLTAVADKTQGIADSIPDVPPVVS